VIVIQARGGVGKTTLARKYLQQEFETVLEFPIAKETKDIASIESLIEEKLRQLGEEPGREFLVSIDRLKRKLQSDRVGILIDNLEPALDSAGKFIEPHRRYVELLRVLADPSVRSLTLITSRERLNEYSISVQPYLLRELSLEAWKQFFLNRFMLLDSERKEFEDADSSALASLQNAYGGNAKAMDILCGAILTDHGGDIAAYWEVNQHDLLIERALEDLVVGQFDRLQQLDSDAYKLLCRMGCYRYQDVPTVPIEGLLCLLWDVPENRQRRVVRSLIERSLVDCADGEYWLHPVIRGEAIGRLRGTADWNTTNQRIAEHWTKSVNEIDSIEEAIKAFEAYYHYLVIDDFELASSVLLKRRKTQWLSHQEVALGHSLYRLGMIRQAIIATELLSNNVTSQCNLSKLYNMLAVPCRIAGNTLQAIEYQEKAVRIAENYFLSLANKDDSAVAELETLKHNATLNIGLCKLDLWELEEAIEVFSHLYTEVFLYEKGYSLTIISCLAFLYSYLKSKEETITLIDDNYKRNKQLKDIEDTGTGYRLLLLGMAYKNIGENDEATRLFNHVIFFANKGKFMEGSKSLAMSCIAEIYRETGQLAGAIEHQEESLNYFYRTGAKRDLAQIKYQLGLTYQAAGEIEKSDENFQEAIQLFTEMEAPKQVERVRRSMNGKT